MICAQILTCVQLWTIVRHQTELVATLRAKLTVLTEVMTRIRAVAWKAVVAHVAAERTEKYHEMSLYMY